MSRFSPPKGLRLETNIFIRVAMLGVGSSVGRIVIGPIADLVGTMVTFRLSVFFTGVALGSWAACYNVAGILTFAFFYGLFAGAFIAQNPVIAGDFWGVANLGGTFAFLNLVMVPGALASAPLAGFLYETYQSYEPLMLVL